MSIEIIYDFTIYGFMNEYPLHVISILYFIHHDDMILIYEIISWFHIWNHEM